MQSTCGAVHNRGPGHSTMFRIFGASGKKAAEPEGASPEDITKSIEKGDKRISDLESKVRHWRSSGRRPGFGGAHLGAQCCWLRTFPGHPPRHPACLHCTACPLPCTDWQVQPGAVGPEAAVEAHKEPRWPARSAHAHEECRCLVQVASPGCRVCTLRRPPRRSCNAGACWSSS